MTLAQSYDLLGGFMGYVNLGIFVYFASSAYAFGVLYFTFHWLAPEAFIVGVVFSAFLGFLVSFPMFRLRGFYFAVATLALVQLGYYIVTTPPASVIFYTNGYGGINGLAADYIQSYYAIFALAVLTVALVYGISKTRLGLAITSIREDEQIAEASGINTGRTKRIVFVLSSAIAGASGCLFAWSQGSILPSTVFNLSNAFIPVTFALFGGTGTVIGPIIGTGIYSIIDTFLSSPFVQNSAYGNISFYEFAIIGFFLIIVGLFAPDGVIGISKRLISRRVKK
jgi:branched-chain amino acid transport system permease protein